MNTQNRAHPWDEAELRRRLEEAEETIRALRAGEVDALFVEGATQPVHTIAAAHHSYRLLVDQILRGATSLTIEGVVLHANRHFLELLEQPLEAVVGRPIRDFVDASSHRDLASMLEGARRSEVQGSIKLLRASGTTTIHLSLTAIEEGALGRCLILRDRTEQWLYTELQRAEENLRIADRMKDQFLATLAHELRNPLAPIRNAVKILKLKDVQDPELQFVQGVIDRQVDVMGRLLEDLLDISRLSRDQLRVRRSKVEIRAVIDSALETSWPLIEANHHELAVSVPSESLPVHADLMRLVQVFSNLLNNAARYTERGGHIRLSVVREGNEVVVSVKDDGIGIAPEMQPHIFGIFSQAEPARSRSHGGLGIGLSLAERLVALHDGTIEVRSAGVGSGSEFIVRLPLATSEETSVSPMADLPAETPARRCRVLVADDNRDGTDALAVLLRMNGHEVSTAYDGIQAIEIAQERRPDVALIDIAMPTISGNDVCRRIREHPWGKRMFMIALTGGGQEEDRRRTRLAGFDHHVVKPADPEKLNSLLQSLAVGTLG